MDATDLPSAAPPPQLHALAALRDSLLPDATPASEAALATADNADNSALDAIFIAAQFAGAAHASTLHGVVYTCNAAWRDEQLWTGLARVQCGAARRTHLMYAAWKGDTARARWLLARTATAAQLELVDARGWTALAWAAHGGSTATTALLVSAGANVTATFKGGVFLRGSEMTPLSLAARAGHAGVVRVCIGAGGVAQAALDAALAHAVDCGRVDVVIELLRGGASASGDDETAVTPLELAAKHDHVEVLKILLDAGADANANADAVLRSEPGVGPSRARRRSSPLIEAAKRGHVSTLLALLDAGARVDDCLRGASALHSAARFSRADVVRVLCGAGANVNCADLSSWTALHWACAAAAKLGDFEGGDVDEDAFRRDHFGRHVRRGARAAVSSQPTALTAFAHELFLVSNPLHDGDPLLGQMAGDLRACADTIATLLELGADPNKCDEQGRAPVVLIPTKHVSALWPLRALRPAVEHRASGGGEQSLPAM
jgi:ankyrin repeat protein